MKADTQNSILKLTDLISQEIQELWDTLREEKEDAYFDLLESLIADNNYIYITASDFEDAEIIPTSEKAIEKLQDIDPTYKQFAIEIRTYFEEIIKTLK